MQSQPVSIDQGVLTLIGVVLGLVLQFVALYAALKKSIAGPLEREIGNQGELVKQQINGIRDDIRADHDGLASRCNELALAMGQHDTRIQASEREGFVSRERYGYMSEKMGAIESQQRVQDQNIQKLASDLTTTVMESGRAQVAALHALSTEFATFRATIETERRIRREMEAGP